jgi:hypothetical protein
MTEKTASLKAAISFTVKQGQYLAFIDHYSRLRGMSPAESDFRAFFKVTPPLDAGPHCSGYVETSEAGWSAIEGVVEPYIHDLERRVKLRHEDEAFQVCSGIVAGLYRAEQSGFELYEYAEDAPSELAGRAVDIWRRRRRNCAFPRDFVETLTPDWDWLGD